MAGLGERRAEAPAGAHQEVDLAELRRAEVHRGRQGGDRPVASGQLQAVDPAEPHRAAPVPAGPHRAVGLPGLRPLGRPFPSSASPGPAAVAPPVAPVPGGAVRAAPARAAPAAAGPAAPVPAAIRPADAPAAARTVRGPADRLGALHAHWPWQRIVSGDPPPAKPPPPTPPVARTTVPPNGLADLRRSQAYRADQERTAQAFTASRPVVPRSIPPSGSTTCAGSPAAGAISR